MSDLLVEAVKRHKIIAILRRVEPSCLEQTARALESGGIRMLEVAFDHSSPEGVSQTLHAIETVRASVGEEVLVGAGTVLTPQQVEAAAAAGSSFILAPNTDREVIQAARACGMGAIPGAMTPTEIAYAYQCGASLVKVFPSDNLGPGYIRAVRAPLGHIPLLAVGGVDVNNIREFFTAGALGVGIGSKLVNNRQIAAGEFQALTDLARQFLAAVE